MNGGQKIHLPVIALTMGSLHGFHCEFKLGIVFRVEYCQLSLLLRGTCRVPCRCDPCEDCSNTGHCVRHRRSGLVGSIFVIVESKVVLIWVILKRRDTGRYLIDIRSRQSMSFAFIF